LVVFLCYQGGQQLESRRNLDAHDTSGCEDKGREAAMLHLKNSVSLQSFLFLLERGTKFTSALEKIASCIRVENPHVEKRILLLSPKASCPYVCAGIIRLNC
jgi:hypothetical protein